MDRKLAFALSAIIIACSPGRPDERQQPERAPAPIASSTATPERVISTSTPLPTNTPIRAERAPTLNQFRQNDIEMTITIERAKSGENISLLNVLIGNVLRFPWERGEAYVATINPIDNAGKKGIKTTVLSADCIFEAMEAENALGNPVLGGAWKPTKRVEIWQSKCLRPHR